MMNFREAREDKAFRVAVLNNGANEKRHEINRAKHQNDYDLCDIIFGIQKSI